MNKFNVGDEVEIVRDIPAFGLTKGMVGKVVYINSFENVGVDFHTFLAESHNLYSAIKTDTGYVLHPRRLKLTKPIKEQPIKYAIVNETFADKKELRKYLKEHKDEKLSVVSVKKKVEYRVTSVVSLKEK